MELLVWEDAKVEAKDRDLGEGKADDIEPLAMIEVFQDQGNVVCRDRPHICAESIGTH